MKQLLPVKSQKDETRLIRLREVMAKTGLSKSYVYALAKKGLLPKPVKLSERSSAWVESEIQNWIDERIKQRGAA